MIVMSQCSTEIKIAFTLKIRMISLFSLKDWIFQMTWLAMEDSLLICFHQGELDLKSQIIFENDESQSLTYNI